MRALLFIPVLAGVLLTGAACAGAQEPTRVVTVGNGETQTTAPAAADQDTYGSGEVSVSPAPTKAATEADDPDAMTPFTSGRYNVRIHSYDATGHTMVVERVKLGSGDKFCADNGIKNCPPNLAVVGYKDTYTLPVKAGVTVHDVAGGNPDCIGKGDSEFALPGTCKAGVDFLKQLERSNNDTLVQIKTNTKNVYEINELYQP